MYPGMRGGMFVRKSWTAPSTGGGLKRGKNELEYSYECWMSGAARFLPVPMTSGLSTDPIFAIILIFARIFHACPKGQQYVKYLVELLWLVPWTNNYFLIDEIIRMYVP